MLISVNQLHDSQHIHLRIFIKEQNFFVSEILWIAVKTCLHLPNVLQIFTVSFNPLHSDTFYRLKNVINLFTWSECSSEHNKLLSIW